MKILKDAKLKEGLKLFLENDLTIKAILEVTDTNYKVYAIDHTRDNKETVLFITLSLNSSNDVYASVEMDIEGLRDIGGFILTEGVN